MSRKKIIILVLFVVLVFPIRVTIKDGGSTCYRSITYEITFWNGIAASKTKTSGTTVRLFHLFEIYNSFKVVPK